MNCDRAFAKLPASRTVLCEGSEGSSPFEACLHAANLYPVGWLRS